MKRNSGVLTPWKGSGGSTGKSDPRTGPGYAEETEMDEEGKRLDMR